MSEIAAADRPSFAQAFASDATATASAPVTPSTETPAAPASADATAPPAETSTPEGVTTPEAPPQGPIPFDRHDAIVKKAHEERDTFKTQLDTFQQQYGWAKDIPRETLQDWSGIAQQMATNPIQFLEQLQAEIANHPTFGPQLKSHAARTLAAKTAQQADLSPDLVVDDGQGHQIQTFSAERMQSIVQRAIADALQKEVGPIKQDFQTRQQRDQAQQQQAQIAQTVTDLYTTATAELPHFKEHEAEIATALASIDGDPSSALYRAWAKVVLPKLDATSKAAQLDDLKTKAAASTVNPASATVAATNRPTSFNDPRLKW